jgi:tRNA pseudouridine38-40 synthase
MRYFAELAYNGAAYFGWQKQPDQISVQEVIENALSTILGQHIEVVGCGRTDTGVHAKQYFLHFDTNTPLPDGLLRRINKFLPKDIAIFRFINVPPTAHARFDATHRAYEYHIDFTKNPFGIKTRFFYPYRILPDYHLMNEAASLLMQYQEFTPFCKTHSDAKTMRCDLRTAKWEGQAETGSMVFHIASNRFLRGMVRLIVGMCLNVGTGKVQLEDVKKAMDTQQLLPKSWSIGPEGLYLTDIRYDYING